MLPNVRTLHIRTDDADEAREQLAREFGGHSRVPDARGPLGYELFAVGTRGVMAGSTTARLGSTLRAATTGPTLHLPLSSTGRYRVGRRKLEAGNGVAVLLAAGDESTQRAWRQAPGWRCGSTRRCCRMHSMREATGRRVRGPSIPAP